MVILFDMDGVLVDSEPVINAAAIQGLAEFGVNAQPDDFLPFVGAGEDRYVGGVAELHGVPYRVEMKHRVYQIYLEIVDQQIKFYDGVHELLAFLKTAGIPCALASSADRIKIDANLRAAKIDTGTFGAIISGESVVHKKPAPDIYLAAAEAIGAQPADCIVIEDAVNGVMAAKAAHMRCIAVTTSFPAEELAAADPDSICNDIPAVQRLIEELIAVKAR